MAFTRSGRVWLEMSLQMTKSPSCPRPGQPFYIHPNCRDCGYPLVPESTFHNPNTPEEEIWWDQWVCPNCDDDIILDWPEESIEKLKEAVEYESMAQHDTDPPPDTIPDET